MEEWKYKYSHSQSMRIHWLEQNTTTQIWKGTHNTGKAQASAQSVVTSVLPTAPVLRVLWHPGSESDSYLKTRKLTYDVSTLSGQLYAGKSKRRSLPCMCFPVHYHSLVNMALIAIQYELLTALLNKHQQNEEWKGEYLLKCNLLCSCNVHILQTQTNYNSAPIIRPNCDMWYDYQKRWVMPKFIEIPVSGIFWIHPCIFFGSSTKLVELQELGFWKLVYFRPFL